MPSGFETPPAQQDSPQTPLEQLLSRLRAGDSDALGELVSLLYDQLHRIARAHMERQGPDHTLQPTALISEAFLRLDGAQTNWEDQEHFLRGAGRAMRHILIDHARKKASGKALPKNGRVDMDAMLQVYELQGLDMLALEEALVRLEKSFPHCAELVELRFFAGQDVAQCARVLGVSERQCQRWMVFIKGFLHRELSS